MVFAILIIQTNALPAVMFSRNASFFSFLAKKYSAIPGKSVLPECKKSVKKLSVTPEGVTVVLKCLHFFIRQLTVIQ